MKTRNNLILILLVAVLIPVCGVFAANEYILEFDGGSDYVRYNDDATLERMDAATDYTIEAWVYPIDGTVAEYDRVLQRYYSFNIQMWDGNNDGDVADWYFVVIDGSGNHYFNTEGDATLTLDAWNHIAVISNSTDGTLKLFVNGVDVTTSGGYSDYSLRSAQSSDNLYIGSFGTSASFYGGYLDEIRIKNVAENPSNLHYNKTDLPYSSDANTAALFHFDEGTGTTTVNAASSSNATISGATWRAWDYPSGTDLSLPVELTYFKGKSSSKGIILYWETASELENLGFIIERKIEGAQESQVVTSYLKNSKIEGAGSTTEASKYSWIDSDVKLGVTYHYTLTDVDYQGRETSHKAITLTYVEPAADTKPMAFQVSAIYPNPFNPSTNIQLNLDEAASLSLSVYNARGELVENLVQNGDFSAGEHIISWNAGTNSAGIYFIQISSGADLLTQKVMKLN